MSTHGSGRLPDFIIGGAMRSGTTSLYRYLGAHPDVALVPKELGFFTDHYDEGIDWYRRQFAALDAACVGDATADYFARESSMQRIASDLPDVKMIVSLRNPVARAWSHYQLLLERGTEHRPFDVALDHEITRLSDDGPNASGMFYLFHSLYDVHLERAIRLLGRDRLHVVVFERMRREPSTAYRDVCRFLGVDEGFVPANLGATVNAYVTFRSLGVRRVANRLPKPLGRVVARLNTRASATPPALEDAAAARLNELFAPRLDRVEQLVGAVPEWRSDGS